MRYRTLVVFCLCLSLAPAVVVAQGPENSATLLLDHGVLLKASIDKFAYARGELITAVFTLINQGPLPITIEASRTCPAVGQMERSCQPDYDVCYDLYFPIEWSCTEQLEFPHGETILRTKVFKAFESSSHLRADLGQILFLDPWGEPKAYVILLEYDNAAPLAVEQTSWSFVKKLYSQ